MNETHRHIVELELESLIGTLGQFTETFGALNWRQTSALEMLANVAGQHPLKRVLIELAEWLDRYEQGTATFEGWKAAMLHATDIQRIADGSIHDFNNRNNPEWQAASAVSLSPTGGQR